MQNLLKNITLCLALLVAALPARAQVKEPEPGTSINSQATGYFFLPGFPDSTLIESNVVSVLINESIDINLFPDHRSQTRAGQLSTFEHTLINTGNSLAEITITGSNLAGDDFDMDNIDFILPDSEIQMQAAKKTTWADKAKEAMAEFTVTLQPGEVFKFDVSMQVSNSVAPGSVGKVQIQAVTSNGTLILDNVNVLEILEGPVVNTEKTSAGLTKNDNVIVYEITGSNTGDQPARSFNITLDGEPLQKVLMYDVMPANTVFLEITENSHNGQVMYHLRGADTYEFVSAIPQDTSLVDVFAVAFDSIPPGMTFKVGFSVRVNENAAGSIINIANVRFRDPIDPPDSPPVLEPTNPVEDPLPKDKAKMYYYTDDTFEQLSRAIRPGDPLYLKVNAAVCNNSSMVRDSVKIELVSSKTGDIEIINAVEKDGNSGYFFTLPGFSTVDSETAVKNNGTIETVGDDIITATLQCKAVPRIITDQIYVSPYGVIFDSQTGKPVAGITITLIDVTGSGNGGKPGAPGTVYNEEGTEEIENTQTTGASGRFEFPYVKPSTYRIEVVPPAGYNFASNVPPSDLPPNRKVDEAASYGKEFVIADSGAVAFDVPVDPQAQGSLFIEKTASKASAVVGDFITYQIKVLNNSSVSSLDVIVHDRLPFGFKYEKGTAHVDGKSIAEPKGGRGPSLQFNIGTVEANGTALLTYRVLLGPGSLESEGINTAVAKSLGGPVPISSNRAQYKVEVRGGVFTNKGYIIGKVYLDCNENDIQDPGEPGIPGVRIYLENGNFAITDARGKYTFYGITPRKQVLKIDNYSLPPGSKLGVVDNRHALGPSTRFVDLKKGELHRADFTVCNCTTQIHTAIEKRQAAFFTAENSGMDSRLNNDLSLEAGRGTSRKRADASGIVGNNELPDFKNTKTGPSKTASANSVSFQNSDSTTSIKLTLEEAMIHEKAELGFININDNDTLLTSKPTVWIKSMLGARLTLKVNGSNIGGGRISKRSTLAPLSLQAFEYIGVELETGKNVLTIIEKDPFGNKRGEKTITVYAPGRVSEIEISVPENDVPADGTSAAGVLVKLLDKQGLRVPGRLQLTLFTTVGNWLVKDNNSKKPGIQTFIEDGEAVFKLRSTLKPRDAEVLVHFGVMKEKVTVHFLPNLRPLIAAGIIEGTIRLSDGASIMPARSADGFEKELKSLSYRFNNFTADGRVSFFLKGKILGSVLLTAGFDSEKNKERLFRDIRPDEFYPVYGSSSINGYDAQSTGRLYVRVDLKRTFALYGDFITQQRHPAKSLGEYSRTQTGVKLHYEKDWLRLNAFGSQTSYGRQVEEFRALGISGPYKLSDDQIVVNSEQVTIITRDRNQPAVVIEREQLTRFRDYVIEPFTGNIIFRAPVPGVDENFNPIFIHVTYEVRNGSEDYWIGGFDGQFKVTDFLEVGGSFVEERNPQNNYRLKSVNSTLRLSENTVLIAEAAESTTDKKGTGRGARVVLEHKGNVLDVRAFAGRTDADFVNPSSTLRAGRTEAKAQSRINLTKTTDFTTEFIYSRNDTLDNYLVGGLFTLQQQISDYMRLAGGFRYAKRNRSESAASSGEDITHKNIRGKLTLDIPFINGLSLFSAYEQDVSNSSQRYLAIGGDYQITNFGKFYARHEFISSARGAYTLNSRQQRQNTVLGFQIDFLENGKVYSEYQIDNAISGRNAQAAIGVQNRFVIYEGFGINARAERIFGVSGEASNEGTSVALGVDYTANPLWKATGRLEGRFTPGGNNYLSTLGYARKISPNWTFLGKNIFNLQTSKHAAQPNRLRERLRTGVAYRQAERNRWTALARYELKYEENGLFSGEFQRLVHIFSTNINYRPNANWTHSARLSVKKVGESSAQFDSESLMFLLSARTIYDITDRLDAGLNVSLMSDANFDSRDYGLGAELGYILTRNLRLAIGFNLFGFKDRDLTASNYTQKGVYLGFSYKFDERLFNALIPGEEDDKRMYLTCNKCTPNPEPAVILQPPASELTYKPLQPVEVEPMSLTHSEWQPQYILPKGIHFATDKSYISDASEQVLNLVAEFLRGQDQFKLLITGHTDSRASYAYNLALSQRRAKSVRRYLVSQGVNSDLVTFKGMSEGDTEAENERDAIERALDRRAELKLNIPYFDVIFISQMHDLQIDKYLSKNLPSWTYIFNTQLNAVPDRIHIKDSGLSFTTKYMLRRIVIALNYYPDETATFNNASDEKKKAVMSYLKSIDADMKRIKWNAGGQSSGNSIAITYKQDSVLNSIEQRDDLMYANNKAIQPLLAKMLELLELSRDYLMIVE